MSLKTWGLHFNYRNSSPYAGTNQIQVLRVENKKFPLSHFTMAPLTQYILNTFICKSKKFSFFGLVKSMKTFYNRDELLNC